MLRDLFSLFPAYAGVILAPRQNLNRYTAFPRICGGDPEIDMGCNLEALFSPHMRG